jgi:diacylglycerol kinase family enzyme
MRVVLIHNPTAGGRGHGAPDLVAALERAGNQVVAYASVKERDWEESVDVAADVIVAAGGDGTVRKVALAVAAHDGTRDVPLTMLPLGTANNVASAFGISGELGALAAGLARARTSRLAVGVAFGPWGAARFVEAAGVGAFAAMLHVAETASHARKQRPTQDSALTPRDVGATQRRLAAGLAHFAHRLTAAKPRDLAIRADGRELSGEYVLVEVMNIPSVGPGVELARNADPADDWLELVTLEPAQLPAMLAYVERLAAGEAGVPPIQPVRIRQASLRWPAAQGHIDDRTWPAAGATPDPGAVDVHVETFVHVLVPEPLQERAR